MSPTATHTAQRPTATVVCGGVGAARFLRGLSDVIDPSSITALVNVGDDAEMHGLHISPDLDTVMYTLADAIDPDRGWGLRDETWSAMEVLGRYDNPTWFSLGDRDLATHIVRTQRLAAGHSLTAVTAHLRRSWGIDVDLRPVTDDPVRTKVTVHDDGTAVELDFQEYFVGRQHDVDVHGIRFAGVDDARPAPGVLDAIDTAEVVLVAPSNPLVSIDPVLAVPGVRDAVAARRASVVAVSPIVGGRALKGPAARMLHEAGIEASAIGVARHYRDVIGTLVIDHADADSGPAIEELGIDVVVTDTVMRDPDVRAALARTTLETVER